MMLLQAGQFGLTRNVLNPGLPPSVVAGGTLWFDASDINTLYTTWPSGGGSLITTDGQSIGAAANKINAANGLFGDGIRPVHEVTGVNGLSSAVFSDPSGVSAAFGTTNTSGSPIASSSFVTTTIKNMVMAVKVNSAAADTGVAYTNRTIVGEGSGNFGLQVTDPGGGVNLTARAYNFSAGSQEATANFAKSTWVVLTYSHQAGAVRVRVNGGAWATTTSGATDSIAQPLNIGSNSYSAVTDFEMVHLMVMNTTQTDASLGFCEQWIANELGLTPWW